MNLPKMDINCRFPACQWIGSSGHLYSHCLANHPQHIRAINEENGFNFVFSDVMEDAFLLVDHAGLYWFLMDPSEDPEYIRRGIFAIGNAGRLEYSTKIGRTGDGCVIYIGPFEVQPADANRYDLEWTVEEIETINDNAPSRSLQVFFGSYNDAEVFMGTYKDITDDEIDLFDNSTYSVRNNRCIGCYDDEWNRANCPICTAVVALDLGDCDNEENLLRSLIQFSEIPRLQIA